MSPLEQQEHEERIDFANKIVSTTWKKIFVAIGCTFSLICTITICTFKVALIYQKNINLISSHENRLNIQDSITRDMKAENEKRFDKIISSIESQEKRISDNEYDINKLQYKIK